MPTYRLDIHLRRTVTAYIQAEDESDIDEFLVQNPDFNILEDYPEMVEGDETSPCTDDDDTNEELGYDLTECDGVTAGWVITPALQLEELD